MSNLMSLSKKTLFYGAIILAATLGSAVGANYVLAANPAAENDGATVEDVEAKIRTAVRNGDMTREQAAEKLDGLRTREDSREIDVEDVQASHQAAVERGDLTQEQADARLEAWKKGQAERLRTREDSREIDVEDVQARLQVAVERGDLTQEQADARLEAWKKAQAERLRTRETPVR